MECIIETGTSAVRTALWKEYFLGQLSKLAAHPVANFLVAKFLNHLSTDQISSSLDELLNALPKLIKEGRSGVVLALVARADALGELDGSKMTKVCLDNDGDGFLTTIGIVRFLYTPLKFGEEVRSLLNARPPDIRGMSHRALSSPCVQ
jgi:hypothetical protein